MRFSHATSWKLHENWESLHVIWLADTKLGLAHNPHAGNTKPNTIPHTKPPKYSETHVGTCVQPPKIQWPHVGIETHHKNQTHNQSKSKPSDLPQRDTRMPLISTWEEKGMVLVRFRLLISRWPWWEMQEREFLKRREERDARCLRKEREWINKRKISLPLVNSTWYVFFLATIKN